MFEELFMGVQRDPISLSFSFREQKIVISFTVSKVSSHLFFLFRLFLNLFLSSEKFYIETILLVVKML